MLQDGIMFPVSVLVSLFPSVFYSVAEFEDSLQNVLLS